MTVARKRALTGGNAGPGKMEELTDCDNEELLRSRDGRLFIRHWIREMFVNGKWIRWEHPRELERYGIQLFARDPRKRSRGRTREIDQLKAAAWLLRTHIPAECLGIIINQLCRYGRVGLPEHEINCQILKCGLLDDPFKTKTRIGKRDVEAGVRKSYRLLRAKGRSTRRNATR